MLLRHINITLVCLRQASPPRKKEILYNKVIAFTVDYGEFAHITSYMIHAKKMPNTAFCTIFSHSKGLSAISFPAS
jgi:hypothetical protein